MGGRAGEEAVGWGRGGSRGWATAAADEDGTAEEEAGCCCLGVNTKHHRIISAGGGEGRLLSLATNNERAEGAAEHSNVLSLPLQSRCGGLHARAAIHPPSRRQTRSPTPLVRELLQAGLRDNPCRGCAAPHTRSRGKTKQKARNHAGARSSVLYRDGRRGDEAAEQDAGVRDRQRLQQ